jgi:glutaredoxin
MRALPILLLSLLACSAAAQQYRWVDEKGRVQYSDVPPPASAKGVEKKNLKGSVVEASVLPFALSQAVKDAPVTLYTSPTCKAGCDMARDALNRRGVPFREVQVWDGPSNEELLKVSGADSVPTMVVGRTVQKGFEAGAFDRALDIAGYPKVLPARKQGVPPLPEGYVPPGQVRQVPAPAPAPAPVAQ